MSSSTGNSSPSKPSQFAKPVQRTDDTTITSSISQFPNLSVGGTTVRRLYRPKLDLAPDGKSMKRGG